MEVMSWQGIVCLELDHNKYSSCIDRYYAVSLDKVQERVRDLDKTCSLISQRIEK